MRLNVAKRRLTSVASGGGCALIARSNASSTRSIIAWPVRRSTDASGYWAKKSTTIGATNCTMPCWQERRSWPRGVRLLRAGDLVGLLQVVQDLYAPLVVAAADLGQADPPGGTVQQAHAERVFQPLDLVADRRLRQVQAAACSREAAALGDPH